MKGIFIPEMKVIIRSAFIIGFALNSYAVFSQTNIFELMERTDLTLQQTENWADNYFERVGTGQGSGFKQYQRWLYERKFHVDDNGYYINPDAEDKAYSLATEAMAKKGSSPFTWTELGPRNWTHTSGWNPGVGRITSVAVHPSDPTTIYVSSPGGGIWKSINSGSSWTPLIDFVNSSWMNVYHLYIDPGNPSTLYASLTSGGVLKSTNAGLNWSATGSGPSGSKQVKVHPSNSNIIFCAANNGIWRSTNGGTSWTQVESNTKEDIEFNPANPDIMYASGSGGTSCVWRSTDNGMTWIAIGSASGITNTGRTLLGVSPGNPNVVYAAQASSSIFGRMYKSTDAGLTYITTVTGNPSSGTNYFGYESTGTGTTGQATYDMAICVNPVNANEVHIGGIICWKSVDGGTSFVATTVWTYPNSTGYNHADIHALEYVNGILYSGSDGGIFRSVNNAGDWTDLSPGLGIRQFYRIACSRTNPNVITTGAQDNGSSFRRSDGSWVDWLGADGMDNVISPTDAAIAIGTSQKGSIYKTINSGATRISLTKPSEGNWVTPLVMDPTSHDTVYGGWTGVWRSGNGGSSWTNLSPEIDVTLDVLAVAPSNTKYIYTSKGTTLYKTTNGGSSWSSVTAPASITSIFVSKYNPLKIWISCNSTSNRVFVSTDGGTNLTNISGGLPAISARSVVVDEDASGAIYLGMNIGVYYKDDITNIWSEYASGLPLVAINEVEIQKSGNKLRVATYGRGIWEVPIYSLGIPGLATSAVSGITLTTAVSGGNITSDGGGTITARGVCWATTSNPTISNPRTTDGTGNGSFVSTLTGLLPGATYHVRSYATNSAGTGYGNDVSFTTASLSISMSAPSGSIIVVQGNNATLTWSGSPTAGSVSLRRDNDNIWENGTGETWIAVGLASSGTYTWNTSGVPPGNYYVAAMITDGNGLKYSYASGRITICSIPGATTVSGGGTYCNSATLTANGGSGGTIFWQGTTSNGTSTSTPSTNQTVTSSGTYYFRSYNSCGWGTQGSATVTLNTSSTAPTGASANLNSICQGGSSTLTRLGGSLGTGASWNWYSGSCGSVYIGSGNSISVSPTSTTTYYVRAEGSCNNTSCATVTVTVHVCTGIETKETFKGISIYPNPADDNLIIENDNSKGPIDFEIVNSNGKKLYNSILNNRIIIDLGQYSPGIYYIKFTDESANYILKFIKE